MTDQPQRDPNAIGPSDAAWANAFKPRSPEPRKVDGADLAMYLGIFSIPALMACGIGLAMAIAALLMARSLKREVAMSKGALLGTTEVKAAEACAWVTLGLAAVVVVGIATSGGLFG